MTKAKLKTSPNDGSVEAFLESVENEQKKADCKEILVLSLHIWKREILQELIKESVT